MAVSGSRKAYEGMDSRVAADRLRRDSHVATDLAVTHDFTVDVAPAGEASIRHLHARRNLRCGAVVPDRLAVHTGHLAHAGFRDTLHAGSDLRHDPVLFTGMAMLTGCAAVSGTATAAAAAATTARAAAAGIATVRLPDVAR
jgi:hypothetical protein